MQTGEDGREQVGKPTGSLFRSVRLLRQPDFITA